MPESPGQLVPPTDAEFAKDLAQVVLDGAGADEQPGGNLPVGQVLGDQPGGHQLWNELTSLRFLDGPYGALILGPVGVGKTHLATALGNIAVRRRRTVHMGPAAKLFKRPGRPREGTH